MGVPLDHLQRHVTQYLGNLELAGATHCQIAGCTPVPGYDWISMHVSELAASVCWSQILASVRCLRVFFAWENPEFEHRLDIR